MYNSVNIRLSIYYYQLCLGDVMFIRALSTHPMQFRIAPMPNTIFRMGEKSRYLSIISQKSNTVLIYCTFSSLRQKRATGSCVSMCITLYEACTSNAMPFFSTEIFLHQLYICLFPHIILDVVESKKTRRLNNLFFIK